MNSLILLLLTPAILAFGAGRTVPCSDNTPALVRVPFGKVTTINFPTSPKEAIPGEAGFDIKRIGEDLVIKPVKLSARTNLVVYLENRRCFFHLDASSGGEESVFVRDPKSTTIEAKYVDQK